MKYPHVPVQVEQEVIGLNCNKKDLGQPVGKNVNINVIKY